MPPVNKHTARSEATRAKLLAAARELFATRGYDAVSTEELVVAAGVTRGSLYHQFSGKEELFAAVFAQIEEEVIARIGATIAEGAADGALRGLEAGVRASLDAALERDLVRVILIDAPRVLGWDAWRAATAHYGLGLVRAGLAGAMDEGTLPRSAVDPLAQLLLAAVEEAMLYVARAEDPAAARDEAADALSRMLRGLGTPG